MTRGILSLRLRISWRSPFHPFPFRHLQTSLDWACHSYRCEGNGCASRNLQTLSLWPQMLMPCATAQPWVLSVWRGELGKHLFVDPDCGKHAPEPGQVSWWVIVCGWQLRMWSGASFFLRTKTQFSFLGRVKKRGLLVDQCWSIFFFPRLWMSLLTGDSWCVLVFGRPNWALEAGRTRVGGRNGRNGRNGTIQMNPLNPILNPNDVQRCRKMYKDCKIYKPKKKHEETVTLNEKNRIRLHALHWLCLQYLAIAAWQRDAKSNKDAYLRFSCWLLA